MRVSFFLQYLLENNRMVNIFTDLYYLTFVQELNKSLSTWQPTLLPNSKGQSPSRPRIPSAIFQTHRPKSGAAGCASVDRGPEGRCM